MNSLTIFHSKNQIEENIILSEDEADVLDNIINEVGN
jgi:hypothetical protein